MDEKSKGVFLLGSGSCMGVIHPGSFLHELISLACAYALCLVSIRSLHSSVP